MPAKQTILATMRALGAERRSLLAKTKLVGTGLAIAVLLNACSGADSGSPLTPPLPAPPPPPPVILHANISGVVSSAATGAPVTSATASIAVPVTTTNPSGTMTATANSTGAILFSNVPASTRTVVHITASGFVDGYPTVNAVLGFTSTLSTQLVPIAVSAPISTATGGTASVPSSTASLTVPANSLTLASGSAATGQATMTVTPYDPSHNLASLPGDATASTNQRVEMFGAVAVSGTDASGNALSLGAGQTATINIPLSTSNITAPPSSLTLFSFDPSTGLWVAHGTANLVGTAPNQYYQGTISQLGIWTVGQPITPAATVNGCVTDAATNAPVANVRIVGIGIGYSSESTAISAADGTFHLQVKPNATVIINGQLADRLTNTQPMAAGVAGSSSTMNACLSLASLAGAPRITLAWGLFPHDLDSHLFAPDGTHVDWMSKGSLTSAPYAKLDFDYTNSYGPEVITLSRMMVGTYTYGVMNFSQDGASITTSPTRVEFVQGAHLTVFTPTAAMGESSSDNWWTVFRFTVDAHCNISITPIYIFSPGVVDGPNSPALPTAVPAQYCAP